MACLVEGVRVWLGAVSILGLRAAEKSSHPPQLTEQDKRKLTKRGQPAWDRSGAAQAASRGIGTHVELGKGADLRRILRLNI